MIIEIVQPWEYCVFVFIACLGMLQLIAACNQLKGMLFIQNRPITLLLAISAVVFAFWWFFFRNNRLDTVMRRTGLEGSQQFTIFCWTTFAALVITLVAASLIQMFLYRRKGQCRQEEHTEGTYPLRHMTFFEALRKSLRQRDRSDAGSHHPS